MMRFKGSARGQLPLCHRPVVRGVVQGREYTEGGVELMPTEPPSGRRFINDTRRAVRAGKLRKRCFEPPT